MPFANGSTGAANRKGQVALPSRIDLTKWKNRQSRKGNGSGQVWAWAFGLRSPEILSHTVAKTHNLFPFSGRLARGHTICWQYTLNVLHFCETSNVRTSLLRVLLWVNLYHLPQCRRERALERASS
jgi:hypothetical protein